MASETLVAAYVQAQHLKTKGFSESQAGLEARVDVASCVCREKIRSANSRRYRTHLTIGDDELGAEPGRDAAVGNGDLGTDGTTGEQAGDDWEDDRRPDTRGERTAEGGDGDGGAERGVEHGSESFVEAEASFRFVRLAREKNFGRGLLADGV